MLFRGEKTERRGGEERRRRGVNLWSVGSRYTSSSSAMIELASIFVVGLVANSNVVELRLPLIDRYSNRIFINHRSLQPHLTNLSEEAQNTRDVREL